MAPLSRDSNGTIGARDNNLKQMERAARDWSAKGKIDPVSNLANPAVWVFHGYNDGVVKLPVSQALVGL